jgi:hypothetical protein
MKGLIIVMMEPSRQQADDKENGDASPKAPTDLATIPMSGKMHVYIYSRSEALSIIFPDSQLHRLFAGVSP